MAYAVKDVIVRVTVERHLKVTVPPLEERSREEQARVEQLAREGLAVELARVLPPGWTVEEVESV